MSYVSVDAPLPCNSLSPVSQASLDAARATVQNVERMAKNGTRDSSMLATPQSFAGLGLGVQRDVARSQRELVSALRFKDGPPKPESGASVIRNAPTVLPLSVPVEQFAGCSIRGITAQPMTISEDQQRVVMPPRAPTDTAMLNPGRVTFSPGAPAPAPSRDMRYWGLAGTPSWGDAMADPGARMNGQSSGMSGKNLLLLGLGALGLYAVTRKKGRR